MTHTGTALASVSDTLPRNNVHIWVIAWQASDKQKTHGLLQRLNSISEECLQFFNPRRHPLEGPSRPCASQLRTGPAAQRPPAELASARVAQIATRGSKSRPAALAPSNKLGGGLLKSLHRDTKGLRIMSWRQPTPSQAIASLSNVHLITISPDNAISILFRALQMAKWHH